MNQEEIEILRKAKEIQLKQNIIFEEQKKEQQRLIKLKRKHERLEEDKRKKLEQIETQKQATIKKAKFDESLPVYLEEIAVFDNLIKKANLVVNKAQVDLINIEKQKYQFMRSFSNQCVHSYGPEYYKQYDTYKKCIYCADEICTHEKRF